MSLYLFPKRDTDGSSSSSEGEDYQSSLHSIVKTNFNSDENDDSDDEDECNSATFAPISTNPETTKRATAPSPLKTQQLSKPKSKKKVMTKRQRAREEMAKEMEKSSSSPSDSDSDDTKEYPENDSSSSDTDEITFDIDADESPPSSLDSSNDKKPASAEDDDDMMEEFDNSNPSTPSSSTSPPRTPQSSDYHYEPILFKTLPAGDFEVSSYENTINTTTNTTTTTTAQNTSSFFNSGVVNPYSSTSSSSSSSSTSATSIQAPAAAPKLTSVRIPTNISISSSHTGFQVLALAPPVEFIPPSDRSRKAAQLLEGDTLNNTAHSSMPAVRMAAAAPPVAADSFDSSTLPPIPKKSSISALFPKPFSTIFPTHCKTLNSLQLHCYPTLIYSSQNVTVSAPTGSGKTLLFEMSIISLLLSQVSSNPQIGRSKPFRMNEKMVYIAPNRALCDERLRDWSSRFGKLGIKVAKVTGDLKSEANSSFGDESVRLVASSQLILTTPEKWDSVTRRWKDKIFLLGSVKLLLIDEVHLLGDRERGGCLESLIVRMKTIKKMWNDELVKVNKSSSVSEMRIIAVSATLPNVVDIGAFLACPPSCVFSFDETFRPVPLSVIVKGCGVNSNEFLFDKSLSDLVERVITDSSEGKPTIVFCHTKKDTEVLAASLAKNTIRITRCSSNVNIKSLLKAASQKTNLASLRSCILSGVAYHHAGLAPEDRLLVEQLFLSTHCSVLCATSTLAMGVNLPARLVIVKGTRAWRGTKEGHKDIDSSTLLQMMGRAGRPGYDIRGTAVILTDNSSVGKFKSMSSGMDTIESRLSHNFEETTNAEISQFVIVDVPSALNWLKSTFYYIRMKKNPKFYDLKGDDASSETAVDNFLQTSCVKSLQELASAKIIEMEDAISITPLPASFIMSKNLVPFESMKILLAIAPEIDMHELLHILSTCVGIQVPVRRAEKKLLNDLHASCKFKIKADCAPSKARVQLPSQKVFVLLQASISGFEIEAYSMRCEVTGMVDYAIRMLKALEEYAVEQQKFGSIAFLCLQLKRSLEHSLWKSSDGMLNQLPGVGAKTTAKLKERGLITFFDVVNERSDGVIEKAASRKAPFAKELRNCIGRVLKGALSVTVELEGTNSNTVVCEVTPYDLSELNIPARSQGEKTVAEYTLLVATDHPSDGLLMFRKGIKAPGRHTIVCVKKWGTISARLFCNFVGMDVKAEIRNTVNPISYIGDQFQSFSPKASPRAAAGSKKSAATSKKGAVTSKSGSSAAQKKSNAIRNLSMQKVCDLEADMIDTGDDSAAKGESAAAVKRKALPRSAEKVESIIAFSNSLSDKKGVVDEQKAQREREREDQQKQEQQTQQQQQQQRHQHQQQQQIQEYRQKYQQQQQHQHHPQQHHHHQEQDQQQNNEQQQHYQQHHQQQPQQQQSYSSSSSTSYSMVNAAPLPKALPGSTYLGCSASQLVSPSPKGSFIPPYASKQPTQKGAYAPKTIPASGSTNQFASFTNDPNRAEEFLESLSQQGSTEGSTTLLDDCTMMPPPPPANATLRVVKRGALRSPSMNGAAKRGRGSSVNSDLAVLSQKSDEMDYLKKVNDDRLMLDRKIQRQQEAENESVKKREHERWSWQQQQQQQQQGYYQQHQQQDHRQHNQQQQHQQPPQQYQQPPQQYQQYHPAQQQAYHQPQRQQQQQTYYQPQSQGMTLYRPEKQHYHQHNQSQQHQQHRQQHPQQQQQQRRPQQYEQQRPPPQSQGRAIPYRSPPHQQQHRPPPQSSQENEIANLFF